MPYHTCTEIYEGAQPGLLPQAVQTLPRTLSLIIFFALMLLSHEAMVGIHGNTLCKPAVDGAISLVHESENISDLTKLLNIP